MFDMDITCTSGALTSTIPYTNVISIQVDTDIQVPIHRVLSAKDHNPKYVEVYRSDRYISLYQSYNTIPWVVVQLVVYDPRYRRKLTYKYYIEQSDHVAYTIHIHKT